MTSEDDPFHDCELDRSDPRNTHLRRCPVHRRHGNTGERADWRDTSAFASDRRGSEGVRCEYRHGNTQIALPASVDESQVETQSKPYTAAAFFHFKATGSLKRHRAYHAAYESDGFAVDFEADYESGDLTITVGRADEA